MKEEVVVFRANEFLRTQARLRFPKDFPDGRVVKNLPCKAGDMGSIPGWGTKVPHAMWCREVGGREGCTGFVSHSQFFPETREGSLTQVVSGKASQSVKLSLKKQVEIFQGWRGCVLGRGH